MFDLKTFDVEKFDSILSRGLSAGLGKAGSQVCIEAAICETLGLGHSDDPKCVSQAVRSFKIKLNDSPWSSASARAAGLRSLGIAQLGSAGTIDGYIFAKKVAEKTIRRLIPMLFRDLFPNDKKMLDVAKRCEDEGTGAAAANAAANAASNAAATAASAYTAANAAAYAANAASYAANAAANAAAYAASASAAANAAAYAANAAATAASASAGDKYLSLSAEIALEVLREMNSPGIQLL